ncbi:MAG TPA: (5-formylfuran-3-yl)methyl phosphate synthase [Thermoplasmata archaeon]|nr:(5-formylfuran-3-yl)methyl phosphate synthase [Thermoplasmata archaeon]
MLLMVSVQDLEEAREAVNGRADIVDVKNLKETIIGSNFPPVIREVRAAFPKEIHVSVTLGAVPDQAGTVSLAVFGAAALGATSVKVGILGSDPESALRILRESRRALEGYPTKLIAATFADSHLYHGIDPSLVVQLARDSRSDGMLIDTLTKDGRNLFDFMPEPKLKALVDEAKELRMSAALSGALRMTDLDVLARINPDIVGVRGAVCARGDRVGGKVEAASVAKVKHALEQRLSGEIDVFARAPSGVPAA